MSDPLVDKLNATVTRRWDVAPGLSIFRVVPDDELFEFVAGQYCVLGLPPSFPRAEGSEPEEPPIEGKAAGRLVRRAYSIASSSKQREYLEFYVTMVTSGQLTPRIFALPQGGRIWLGPKATGLFTLREIPEDAKVLLLATGTGLAPYMSMLEAELAHEEDRRQVVVAHGARNSWDLGYRAELEVLARKIDRLTYIPSVTRPEADPSWQGESGYLQDQLTSGRIEELAGFQIDPADTHVFLCGNPAMITAVTEELTRRGLREWTQRDKEGQIHTEKYW